LTKDEVLAVVAKAVEVETGIAASSVTLGTNIASLDIDSLSILTILTNVEDDCNMRFPDSTAEFVIFGDIVDYVLTQI
jgi:acyl carrier protein